MPSPRLLDSKRIHRLLFGAYYQEDVFDRLGGIVPLVLRMLAPSVLADAYARNLLFLHVPRTGGASISHALHGKRCVQHYRARCLKMMAPRLWDRAESFAVLRDPLDRFASSYAFVRSGGTPSSRLSDVFRQQTAHIRCVDDYLAFIEGRDVLDLDFVMRPQSWFVCDPDTNLPLVRHLFLYGRDHRALLAYLESHGVTDLPWLNRSARVPLALSRRQRLRIEKIYADDFALLERLSARKPAASGIAAE